MGNTRTSSGPGKTEGHIFCRSDYLMGEKILLGFSAKKVEAAYFGQAATRLGISFEQLRFI